MSKLTIPIRIAYLLDVPVNKAAVDSWLEQLAKVDKDAVAELTARSLGKECRLRVELLEHILPYLDVHYFAADLKWAESQLPAKALGIGNYITGIYQLFGRNVAHPHDYIGSELGALMIVNGRIVLHGGALQLGAEPKVIDVSTGRNLLERIEMRKYLDCNFWDYIYTYGLKLGLTGNTLTIVYKEFTVSINLEALSAYVVVKGKRMSPTICFATDWTDARWKGFKPYTGKVSIAELKKLSELLPFLSTIRRKDLRSCKVRKP